MMETRAIRQETTAVHDVLSLFRDKIVHDVMNPDKYQIDKLSNFDIINCNDRITLLSNYEIFLFFKFTFQIPDIDGIY